MTNYGFESGISGWTESSTGGFSLIADSTQYSANTGAKFAWLGGYNGGTDVLWQNLTVPTGSQSVKLQFWYQIRTDEASTLKAYDTLAVEVYNATSGAKLATLASFSNLNKTSAWVQSPAYDLSAYKGVRIQLKFTAVLDSSETSSFLIDDVSIAPLDTTGVQPQTGWWWNPAEGGRGFAIERQGNQLFMAAFLYENYGSATWYVATMTAQADGSYTGALTRYAGGQTLTGSYKAPSGTTTPANASLSFQSPTVGALTVQPTDGSAPRTIVLERFPISTPAFMAASSSFQSGWWWNAAQGGRGFFVEVQGSQAFVGSFMYDDTGHPVWYVSSASIQSNNRVSGALQQYSGGQSLTGTFKNAVSAGASLGTLAISFDANGGANMALPNGSTVALTRFTFNSAGSTPAPPPPSGTVSAPSPINVAKIVTLDEPVALSGTGAEFYAIQLTAGTMYSFDSGPAKTGTDPGYAWRFYTSTGASFPMGRETNVLMQHFGWTPPSTGIYYIQPGRGSLLIIRSHGKASSDPYTRSLVGKQADGSPFWLSGSVLYTSNLNLETPLFPMNVYAGEIYRFRFKSSTNVSGEVTLTSGDGRVLLRTTVPAFSEVTQNVVAAQSDTYYLQHKLARASVGAIFFAATTFLPDTDGDGDPDETDPYPNDPTRNSNTGGGSGGGTGGGGSAAEQACVTKPYTGDSSEPQVYFYDYLAQKDQCLFRVTGNQNYVVDGDRQCKVLTGLITSLISQFRPQYCNGSVMIR